MTPLYTDEQFANARSSKDKLPLECEHCHKPFEKLKAEIQRILAGRSDRMGRFCSRACHYLAAVKTISMPCDECGKQVSRTPKESARFNRVFCSHSCSARYSNTHKAKGTRRSKLEQFIEQKLTEKYPDLEVFYNQKAAINSELDIYVPSLKLAFELNGIFHYEPIFGPEKLSSIQNNDNRKFQACAEVGIGLCIIDTSSQKKFKPKSAERFLSIVTTLIDKRLSE